MPTRLVRTSLKEIPAVTLGVCEIGPAAIGGTDDTDDILSSGKTGAFWLLGSECL